MVSFSNQVYFNDIKMLNALVSFGEFYSFNYAMKKSGKGILHIGMAGIKLTKLTNSPKGKNECDLRF